MHQEPTSPLSANPLERSEFAKLCFVCGSDKLRFKVYNRHDINVAPDELQREIARVQTNNSHIFRGAVSICCNCGYGVMDTPPTEDELYQFYSRQFWTGHSNRIKDSDEGKVSVNHNLRAKAQIELLAKYVRDAPMRSLEIGAGDAFASLHLKNHFSQLTPHVCEPGEQWEAHYDKQGIVRIANFFPFDVETPYSIIIASHWLEHVRDLASTVKALHQSLDEQGLLVIDVPNTEYDYWELPERDLPHIHFFTPEALGRVVERGGFKLLAYEVYGISFKQRSKGVPTQPADFLPNKRGIGVRAVFRRVSAI